MPSFLPRTVIILGLVSLLNDAGSEMINPLLPLFLTITLGAGPSIVGLIEGIAEATASILKLVSGWLADRGWSARRLVIGGYSFSNLARPLISLANSWGVVIALRFCDRIGKGLRTAPRDVIISNSVDANIRGRAFGFHRAFDHLGAMIGPLIAFALLQSGMPLRDVFLVSIVPGIGVVVLLVYGLPKQEIAVAPKPRAPLHWNRLDKRVKALVLASGGLALATTPEAFLVLWASAGGLEIVWVPLLWAAAHAIRALVAAPAGYLSDSLGRMPIVLTGWIARVGLLMVFAVSPAGTVAIWGLFIAYAAATAFSEGAERALIGDFVPEEQRGTAFGIYHLLSGLLALPGAVAFGVIWEAFGMQYAFITAAVITVVAAVSLLLLTRGQTAQPIH